VRALQCAKSGRSLNARFPEQAADRAASFHFAARMTATATNPEADRVTRQLTTLAPSEERNRLYAHGSSDPRHTTAARLRRARQRCWHRQTHSTTLWRCRQGCLLPRDPHAWMEGRE